MSTVGRNLLEDFRYPKVIQFSRRLPPASGCQWGRGQSILRNPGDLSAAGTFVCFGTFSSLYVLTPPC